MTPPEAAPMREEDASKIAAYFIEAEDGQIVRDMAGHVGDEVHQVLKRHGMMMKSAAGAIGVGVLAGVQILNDTLEFALRSVDTDDERASIAAGIAALIQSEIDDSLAHTARPDAGDAGRYHFTDENPFEVRTVEGTKKLGRGWLAITEAEYAGLRARPDAQDEVERFWLIIREPGMVPDCKGPFKITDTAKVLPEFMAANPHAFIDYLTVTRDGEPYVDHGPQVLQMTDGRSMAVGRRHNERVKAVALAAMREGSSS
jgi:hypothetical protein